VSTRREARGAALLLALATLVLVVSATATLARVAATSAARRTFGVRTATADDLLVQAEAAAQEWLKREADQVVLPPAGLPPEKAVLHDAWSADDVRHELWITAWDENGMVPLASAGGGSPLRMTLPGDVRAAVDSAGFASGLDQLESGERSPFPEPGFAAPLRFGAESAAETEVEDLAPPDPFAVGAWVATHPLGSRRINVNTAPWPLVEAAMRLAGVGNPEAVRAAREKGQLSAVSAVDPDPQSAKPELVPTSNAWAFRIDIRVGSVRRSWWSVFARPKQDWVHVQRLPIRR